jgi:ribosomal protein S9
MTTATTKPKSSRTKSETDYVEGVGRRKTAIARVRATPGAKNSYTVNDLPMEEYFKTAELRAIVNAPLTQS